MSGHIPEDLEQMVREIVSIEDIVQTIENVENKTFELMDNVLFFTEFCDGSRKK